jgi:hypothetical protein
LYRRSGEAYLAVWFATPQRSDAGPQLAKGTSDYNKEYSNAFNNGVTLTDRMWSDMRKVLESSDMDIDLSKA